MIMIMMMGMEAITPTNRSHVDLSPLQSVKFRGGSTPSPTERSQGRASSAAAPPVSSGGGSAIAVAAAQALGLPAGWSPQIDPASKRVG